jgi:hypothetical protein
MMSGTASGTAFDKIESGEIGFDQSLEHLTGAGGQDSTVYSLITPKGSASTWLQTTTMLSCATKSAVNALPTQIAQIDGGVLGEKMHKQEECYLTSVKLSCEVGGAVKADYEWVALAMTTSAVTAAPAANAKNLLILWHNAGVVLDSNTYACQSWESTLETGVKVHTSLDSKTAGVERMPEAATPGLEKVSLTAEFKAAPTVDFLVAIPATVTFVFTGDNTEVSAKTFLHTVVANPVGMPTKIVSGEEDVTWAIECEADYDSDAWDFTLS